MADRGRAGIIGTGFMGQVHAHALRAMGAELVAVAGSTVEKGRQAARDFQAHRPAATAAELISAPDIDVVHICTPNDTHKDLALAALEAGKHVICEKPLAMSVAEADVLVAAAERSGSVAAVSFVYRSYPMVREARARIASGEAGALQLLHGSYLQDWLADPEDDNWRTDPARGGASRAFGDIGVHWCDLVEFVTGHRIVRLVAEARTVLPERRGAIVHTEDAAMVLFTTDQGATGSVVVSQVSPGQKNRLRFRIDGSEAAYSFDQESPDSLLVDRREHSLLIPRDPSTLSAAAAPYAVLPPGHPQGYQDAFNAFIADTYRAVAGETPEGLATFADGRRAAVITEAVMASARQRTWIEVDR